MEHRAWYFALLITLGLTACGSGGAELVDGGASASTIGETRSAPAPASTDPRAESEVSSTAVVPAPTTSRVAPSIVPSTSPTIDVDGVPLTDAIDLGGDQWVVPAWIPGGMALQFLAAQGRTVSVGPPEWPEGEILLQVGAGIGNQDPAAKPGADGWVVDAGASGWSATRRHPTASIFVLGSGLTQPFDQRFLDGLRVVNAVDLPIEPLDFGSPHHRVATSAPGGASMSVAGGNLGWYSVEVGDATSSSATGPEHFDRTAKVGVLQGGYADDDVAIRVQPHGFATPDVALVEVDLVSGQTVTVIPVDESGRYDDRFWIIDMEIQLLERSDLVDSGRFALEARAVDRDGNVIGRWRHDDPPFEFPKAPLPDPGPIRAPNELVVERRAPTDDERDRLDNDPMLQCDDVSSGTWDYGEIGPDDPRDRVSDDALRDGIDDDTSGPSLPTEGWTELLFGPDRSTFVHTIDDWRAVVSVGGDSDLGVWRFFEYIVCAD